MNINLYISQFSHSQVDTLEIALRDHLDIVDKVFLVEATKSHKGVSGTGIQFPNVVYVLNERIFSHFLGFIPEKNCLSVRFVAKNSQLARHYSIMWWFIQAKNHSNVHNVETGM